MDVDFGLQIFKEIHGKHIRFPGPTDLPLEHVTLRKALFLPGRVKVRAQPTKGPVTLRQEGLTAKDMEDGETYHGRLQGLGGGWRRYQVNGRRKSPHKWSCPP